MQFVNKLRVFKFKYDYYIFLCCYIVLYTFFLFSYLIYILYIFVFFYI